MRIVTARGGKNDALGDADAAFNMIEIDLPLGAPAAPFAPAKPGLRLQAQAGTLDEARRLLGALGTGAFTLSGGRTTFAGVRVQWSGGGGGNRGGRESGSESGKGSGSGSGNGGWGGSESGMGSGMGSGRAGGLTLFGAWYHGITTADGDALIAETRAESQSWTLGIRRAHIFTTPCPAAAPNANNAATDWLEFALHQPLRVTAGEANLNLPPDRHGKAQSALPLAARGRELDFALSYRRTLTLNRAAHSDTRPHAELGIGLLYRHQPGHLPTAPAEYLAVVSYKMEW